MVRVLLAIGRANLSLSADHNGRGNDGRRLRAQAARTELFECAAVRLCGLHFLFREPSLGADEDRCLVPVAGCPWSVGVEEDLRAFTLDDVIEARRLRDDRDARSSRLL